MTVRPRTGNVTEGCYAAALEDCDGPLTDEHYILKSLQREFGVRLIVGGTPWARESKVVGPDIKARVLCRKHNTDVKPYDKAALAVFRALKKAHRGERADIEVDGEHLERWSLKASAGMLASGEHA